MNETRINTPNVRRSRLPFAKGILYIPLWQMPQMADAKHRPLLRLSPQGCIWQMPQMPQMANAVDAGTIWGCADEHVRI